MVQNLADLLARETTQLNNKKGLGMSIIKTVVEMAWWKNLVYQ